MPPNAASPVVELIFQGLEKGLEVREIHQPSGAGVHGTFDGDFDAEGVAMEAAALMAGRHVGQAVGGLEMELLGQLDGEGVIGRQIQHHGIVTWEWQIRSHAADAAYRGAAGKMRRPVTTG